jgi:hypothetical protein
MVELKIRFPPLRAHVGTENWVTLNAERVIVFFERAFAIHRTRLSSARELMACRFQLTWQQAPEQVTNVYLWHKMYRILLCM